MVVIDSKADPGEWAAWGPPRGYVVTRDPNDIARHPLVVFQPDQVDLMDVRRWRDPQAPWTRALIRTFERGNSVVVFDEALQTLPSSSPHPIAVKLLTQGRSRNLSVWAGSQVGNRHETLVARLAEHCLAFRQLHGQDLALLREARGIDCGVLSTLPDWHFAWHRHGLPEWHVFGPVPFVLRRHS